MFSTGLAPDREDTRKRQSEEIPYEPLMSGPQPESLTQTLAFVRNQGGRGSCVGQALCACIDADLLDQDPLSRSFRQFPSAVSLWRYARFLQGNLENVMVGTRAEYAFETLEVRGWDGMREGEDFNLSDDNLSRKDNIEDELFAYDNRLRPGKHQRIINYAPMRASAVVSALHEGKRVVFGAGVSSSYMTAKKGHVAESSELGLNGDGHMQRVFGYIKEGDSTLFMVQNSWGEGWAGITVNGRNFPGCVLARQECIEQAWDIHVFTTR